MYAGVACIAGSLSLGVTACSNVTASKLQTSQEKFEKCMDNAANTTGYERQTLVEICQKLLQTP